MIRPLSHLSFLEIASPDVAGSVDFYVNTVGLSVVDRVGEAVYLRAWGDYYRYSLVVIPGDAPALVSAGWRTASPEDLQATAARVEAAGVHGEWIEGHAIGRAYRFVGPWGHTITLHWEAEHYRVDRGEGGSIYPDRPARRSHIAGAPRQLDHVTVAASDVEAFAKWHTEILGFRYMARTILPEADDLTVFGVLTTNEKSHDLGVVHDTSSVAGRINHYAFWVDTREELLIAADVLMENGTAIEYGPSIHGIGEQSFLYYREPSGLRVELNTGGYRNYVPDWEPQTWTPELGSNNFYRNGAMPHSMSESFPPADGLTATEEGVTDDVRALLVNPYGRHGRG